MSEVYYTTVYCTTIKLELIYLLVYIYRIHLQNECVILWNIDTMTVAHSKYTVSDCKHSVYFMSHRHSRQALL